MNFDEKIFLILTDAHAKIPKNPTFSTNSGTNLLIRVKISWQNGNITSIVSLMFEY